MRFQVLTAFLLLCGCSAQATNGAQTSAFMNGLEALRDGDAARLTAALEASERALTPIRAAPDVCAVADYANRSLAAEHEALKGIAKASAAHLSEDARLLLALNRADHGGFTAASELFNACPYPGDPEGPVEWAEYATAMRGAIAGARARGEFLHAWRQEVRDVQGSQHEARMRVAADLLKRTGYDAIRTDGFVLIAGEPVVSDAPPGRFADVRDPPN